MFLYAAASGHKRHTAILLVEVHTPLAADEKKSLVGQSARVGRVDPSDCQLCNQFIAAGALTPKQSSRMN